MISPGRYDIGADRWVACIRTFAFVGVALTDATYGLQVRQYGDAPGAPLVDLGTVFTDAAEGVHLNYDGFASYDEHIAAGRLASVPDGALGTDGVRVSTINVRINETTMEALPFPTERGADAAFVWDLHIAPSGGVKDKYIGGKFIVRAGATQ